MHELKETVTGEPIGEVNGATITSGVGPANKPTNVVNPTKRDALYKPLFENYFTSEVVRNQMAKALLDELSPHFISAFMLRGEGAINVTAEDILKQDGEDYAQKVVWDTIKKKLDNSAFKDGPDRRGNMRTAFDWFRIYIAKMKGVGYDEADRLLGEIEIHVPLLVEEQGEDAGFGDGKLSEVDNPLLNSPAEFNQTGKRKGDSVQPSAPPDLKELVIFESLDEDKRRKLENWQSCDFDRTKTAELQSIPGHEVTPGNVSTQIFRIIRPRQLEYLALTLAHQFGELQAKEAAEDIFDLIPVLRQRKFADYPKTWAEASELELLPKFRKVKQDAPKSSWVQAVRCLSRLWAREESIEDTEQPEGTNVVSGQPVEAPSPSSCHKAFESVVCRYQESQGSAVGLQAMNYEKAAKSGHGSKTTSKVKPTVSDFICDVEICARRCLTSAEHGYWTLYYKSCAVVVEPGDTDCLKGHIESFPQKYRAAVASIDKRIRLKLGARLIAVGISPFSEYVREFDVRQPKLKEKLSGMLQTIRACAEEFEDESNLLEWPEQNGFDISACAAPSTNSIADRIEEYEHAITVRELAAVLGCSTRQIYELVQDKRLPAIMIGTSIRLDPRQTADWIRSKMTIAA